MEGFCAPELPVATPAQNNTSWNNTSAHNTTEPAHNTTEPVNNSTEPINNSTAPSNVTDECFNGNATIVQTDYSTIDFTGIAFNSLLTNDSATEIFFAQFEWPEEFDSAYLSTFRVNEVYYSWYNTSFSYSIDLKNDTE